jgi:signal transduction histidine kinase/CheY-like chemotaxis protein
MPRSASYHRLAVTRAKELPSRLVYGLVIAAGVWAITHSLWPVAWFAAMTVMQVVDHLLAGPIQNRPAHLVSRPYELAYVASFALNTTVFSAIAPFCWLSGGLEGHLFAFLIPTAGLINVALQAQASPRLLWAGCIPHAAYLLSLPVLSIVFETSDNPIGMAFVVLGAVLYLAHLTIAVRRNNESADVLGQALSEAKRERIRAETANAAKSEFLATMSHEIRTPLNGVLGMAQAMASKELPDDQRTRLDVIQQSGEVLLTLLNDLLDVSKIEAAKLELEIGVVEMKDIAVQAEAAFGSLAATKGVSLRIRLSDSAKMPRVGDPMRVRQIVYNLLANAVKFTDAGRVTALVSGTDEELVLEVTDTGAGIPADRLSTLFERFTQAEASTTRRYGGSGLGLAISRGLARMMGGEISARSIMGEGSVFTARLPLPLSDAVAPARKAEAAPAAAPSEGVRVLAAEDNPTNRLVLQTLLEQVGIQPHIVENGEEAVKAWREAHWDVILMDVQMPVMDGVAATRAIRQAELAEGRARTPIIALTANAMAHQAAEYTAVGMDALSPKPIQFDQLIATIAAMLDAHAETVAA